MRILERECDSCGRLVRTANDGDLCGACDLALCKACLDGTARCPSCQAPFAATRDVTPLAKAAPSGGFRRWHITVALLIAAASVWVWRVTQVDVPPQGRVSGVGRLGTSHDGGLLGLLASPDPSCEAVRARAAGVFERLAPMRFAPEAEGGVAWAVTPVLGALDARIRPFRRGGVGPVHEVLGGADPSSVYEIQFVLDGWAEPRPMEDDAAGRFHGGRLTGRIFVNRRSPERAVCASEVDYTSETFEPPSEGDPLEAARVALLLGGLETGIAALRSTTEIGAP